MRQDADGDAGSSNPAQRSSRLQLPASAVDRNTPESRNHLGRLSSADRQRDHWSQSSYSPGQNRMTVQLVSATGRKVPANDLELLLSFGLLFDF